MKKQLRLETAQRLHELADEKGFELPESQWVLIYELFDKEEWSTELRGEFEVTNPIIPVFDCTELGEILKENGYHLPIWSSYEMKKGWGCNIDSGHYAKKIVFEDSEVEARAKMLIYLLQNDLIKNEG